MTTWCRAPLTYAAPSGGLLGGEVEVEIRDGRTASLPGWGTCGFERVDHRSAVGDWTDDEEVAGVHYGEAEALARRLTGCWAALVSDHVKRSGEPPDARRAREQTPVRLVHSDFAANYEDVVRHGYDEVRGRGAATLARTGVTADDVRGAARIVMLQLWRNLGAPKMDLPVAFCDSRTVTTEEVRPFPYTGYVAGGRSFDALAVVAPPPGEEGRHHWYAFPSLTADEVVAFRTYDTDLVREGRTWFTPHSAFRDPEVPAGAPARFSIELRVLCLFAPPAH
ncbi:MAG TPA: CmcJ/NvfI family oxidoreductase [Acidimicrobiales bacterium]|nr:CmcJ/NvfI family oxidoreductase [Acidimicrobiales bacterium]